MKKALVIILSIVMVIAAFAGCSAKKNNNDQTGDPKNTSSVAEEWQKTTITTDNAKISNTSLSNTLRDTNEHIVASPIQDNYYSDITIGKEITKENTIKDTALTLTAGRNIVSTL